MSNKPLTRQDEYEWHRHRAGVWHKKEVIGHSDRFDLGTDEFYKDIRLGVEFTKCQI